MEPTSITKASVRREYIAPPRLVEITGAIDTEHYSYSFGKSVKLCFITRLDKFGEGPIAKMQNEISGVPNTMGTNEAYHLATQWLEAIDVDVGRLEGSHPHIEQQHYYFDGSSQKRVLLPIFDVIWGDPYHPAIIVTIYGPTKELLQIRQEDLSFSRRPAIDVKFEELLKISDSDFVRYSAEQQTNLIAKFVSQEQPNTNGVATVDAKTNKSAYPANK